MVELNMSLTNSDLLLTKAMRVIIIAMMISSVNL